MNTIANYRLVRFITFEPRFCINLVNIELLRTTSIYKLIEILNTYRTNAKCIIIEFTNSIICAN